MKYLVILICVIFQSIYSQDAPKDANTIIISTADKPETAFRNIGRLFVSEKYALETSEPALLMITTKPQKINYGFLSAGTYYLKLQAQINEIDTLTEIILTGLFEGDLKVTNKGMSGSPAKSSWEKMVEIATKYKGGNIRFEIAAE